MKKIILTLSLLTAFVTQATIVDAQENFDKKNYAQSYQEYKQLAHLGNTEAQYNLAIMLYNGQGIIKNPVKAYAWGILASQKKPESIQLLKLIEKKLSLYELNTAKQMANKLTTLYGYNQTKTRLGPLLSNSPPKNKTITNERFYRLNGKTTSTPLLSKFTNRNSKKFVDYPNVAINKGARGWVDLTYKIYPDGSVRDISVEGQYPHEYFTQSAVKFLSKQSFKQNYISHNEPNSKIRIKYGINQLNGKLRRYNISGLLNYHTKWEIKKVLNSALAGDLGAQYKYSEYFYFLLNNGGGVSEYVINKWLYKAAQFGIVGAQFKLGQNIFSGNGTQKETDKGIKWIFLAAQYGSAEAQYFLSQHINNETNFTGKPAAFWLKESAKNQSIIGQFKYAKNVALMSGNPQKTLELANKYLNNYASNVTKTADWYQTKALILYQLTNYQDAYVTIKKAIKVAKKSHWDLSELKQQKSMILNHSKLKA